MPTDVTVFAMLKSCCRCGNEFRTPSPQRVCPACRKPAVNRQNSPRRELTLRELQIIGRIRFGKPNKEIAYELHLTEGTVKEYLNRIFRKLEIHNRTELAVWALQHHVAA